MNMMYDNKALLVDKPLGWTSFQVIKKLSEVLKISKMGHAGTLDPLATGLLIICTGSKTKEISHYQGLDKVYIGEIVLGKTTPSYDRETAFSQEKPWSHVTAEQISAAASKLVGKILQSPPAYSAIKKEGKRAYAKARSGHPIDLPPRLVHVHSFAITKLEPPIVHFRIQCGKGVYIRSIAQDLGEALGTGAYLHSLRRTHIGTFCVDNTLPFSEFFPPEGAKVRISTQV